MPLASFKVRVIPLIFVELYVSVEVRVPLAVGLILYVAVGLADFSEPLNVRELVAALAIMRYATPIAIKAVIAINKKNLLFQKDLEFLIDTFVFFLFAIFICYFF